MKQKQTIEEKIVHQLLSPDLLEEVFGEFCVVTDLSVTPKYVESLYKRFIAEFSTNIAEIAGQRVVSFDKMKKILQREAKLYLEGKIPEKEPEKLNLF